MCSRQTWNWVGRASSLGPTAVFACGLSSREWTVGKGDGGTVGHQWGLSRGREQHGLLQATSEERDKEDSQRKGAAGSIRKAVLFGGKPE